MITPLRITAVLTHPIQYYGAWFRYLHAHVPAVQLTVVYAVEPTSEQQGVGFGEAFTWDVPPRQGYDSIVARPSRPGDSVGTGRFFGVDVPAIGKIVLSTAPDVVLVFGWYSIVLVRAARAARRAGIPVLWRGDTNLGSAPRGLRRVLWHARTRRLLGLFDGFLAVGTRTEAYLRYFGISDTRIVRAPHAVDPALFANARALRSDRAARASLRDRLGLPADAWVACFVGKLGAYKRPLDFIRAAARAGDVAVLVAGTGPLEPECRAEAQRRKVRSAWAGFVNQSSIGDIYAAAEVLVLPSDERETWGLVVNEALASGLPCIVSDAAGAATDLVRGDTGARVPCGDIDQLAAALVAIRTRQRQGEDFSAACLAMAGQHSFAAASAALVQLAERLRSRVAITTRAPRVLVLAGGMVFIGGLERMTFEVLSVLRAQGAAVHCILNAWDSRAILLEAEAIGATWSLGYYHHRLEVPRSPRIVWNLLREAVITSSGLLRDAWRFRPTHVFAPDPWVVLRNLPVIMLLRVAGVKVVVRMGVRAPASAAFQRAMRWLVAPVLDDIVCNSHYTASTLEPSGLRPPRVRVVYNTLPRVVPAAVDGGRKQVIRGRVVFVGQIMPGKGLDRLMHAVAILRQAGLPSTLDVVGNFDDWEPPEFQGFREGLRQRATAPDLAGSVRFLGWQDDPMPFLEQADVHCCPSSIEMGEGFGIVVLEAKTAGVPSVVTPSGALPEILEHGRDGWVCRDDSAEAIAEGLAVFLRDPQLRDAAATRAEQSTAKFTRQQFGEEWTRVFAR